MSWGLILQPQQQYSQHVEKLHLTTASLDLSKTVDDHPVQVMMILGGNATKYLLCTLNKNAWQVPLNLRIEKSTITFSCSGTGYVHLTGYYKNTTLNDPDVVSENVLHARVKKGVTSPEEAMECLEQDETTHITHEEGLCGFWLVQKIDTEKENQENERKATSKRKASSPEDEAARRMKSSANSNENRSNNDVVMISCDKNIENLDDDKDKDKNERMIIKMKM